MKNTAHFRNFENFLNILKNSRLNKSDVKIGEDERFLIGTTVFKTILCLVLRQPAYWGAEHREQTCPAMGVFMDFKKSQHRLPCPQTYRVANKQPSTFSTTKRPSFWLSKTLSFASIHYDGESGRLDEFVLKFSPKWIRLEAKIQIANFRLALYSCT